MFFKRSLFTGLALLASACLSVFFGRSATWSAEGHNLTTKLLNMKTSASMEVPGFSFYDLAQCDRAGNLYFHLAGNTGAYESNVVMRLSRDSNMPRLYQLPSELAKQTSVIEYSVSASGRTSFLGQATDGLYRVFGFDANNAPPSETRLEVSAHVDTTDFIVSEPGVILLGGYYNQSAEKELQGKRFLALLDRTGKVLKDFSSDGLEDVKAEEVNRKVHDGATAAGPDGNFYFLHGSEIMVLSPSGDILRRLRLEKPDKDATARGIAISEGLISVYFGKADKEGYVHSQYLVLDDGTGVPYSLYVPSAELGNNCVCFSRKQGFTFFRVENGKVKLLTAPLT